MFRHNSKVKYDPNGGRYLQILPGKDFYLQTIVISIKKNDTFSSDDTFLGNSPNIFASYPLGEMRTTDTKWKHHTFKAMETQLNFAVFSVSSACGASSEHLNYKKYSVVKPLYRFHLRRVLKRLQILLPHEAGFNP